MEANQIPDANGDSLQHPLGLTRDVFFASGTWQRRREQFVEWSVRIVQFGLVQGGIQLILAIAGLLLVRNLSKAEYALFAIVNSIQVACVQLADLGVGIGVRSIGGRIYQDRFRMGQLVTTALGLRRRFASVALIASLPLLIWLLRENGASAGQIGELSLVVFLALIPLLGVYVWIVTVLLQGEYGRVQKLDLGNALLRLILVSGLVLTRLNAVLGASVGAIVNLVQALFLRHWARRYAEVSAPPNAADRKELLRLSIKALPNTLFFCVQGQVTLSILTMFGNTAGIADITALGRLALLFTVFAVIFGNMLGPRFGRCQDLPRLRCLYMILVGGMAAVLLPLCGLAALFPKPLLWLLGAKYGGLERECAWVVATGCLSQFGGAMWNLSSSRAWIRVQSVGFIPAIIGTQVLAALCLDLRNFHNIVIFNFVTTAAPIPLYAIDAYLGLRSERAVVRS